MKRRSFIALLAALVPLSFLFSKATAKVRAPALDPVGTIKTFYYRDGVPPGWLPCDDINRQIHLTHGSQIDYLAYTGQRYMVKAK